MKYHISNGKPMKCTATKMPCPILKENPNAPHFESKKEAEEYIEKKELKEHGALAIEKTEYTAFNRPMEDYKNMTDEEKKADLEKLENADFMLRMKDRGWTNEDSRTLDKYGQRISALKGSTPGQLMSKESNRLTSDRRKFLSQKEKEAWAEYKQAESDKDNDPEHIAFNEKVKELKNQRSQMRSEYRGNVLLESEEQKAISSKIRELETQEKARIDNGPIGKKMETAYAKIQAIHDLQQKTPSEHIVLEKLPDDWEVASKYAVYTNLRPESKSRSLSNENVAICKNNKTGEYAKFSSFGGIVNHDTGEVHMQPAEKEWAEKCLADEVGIKEFEDSLK